MGHVYFHHDPVWTTPPRSAVTPWLDSSGDGERLGIDQNYISDMETRKKNVCLPTLEVVAQGLGPTISKLLSGIDPHLTKIQEEN